MVFQRRWPFCTGEMCFTWVKYHAGQFLVGLTLKMVSQAGLTQ